MNANLFVHSEKFYVRRVFNFPLLFLIFISFYRFFFNFIFHRENMNKQKLQKKY